MTAQTDEQGGRNLDRVMAELQDAATKAATAETAFRRSVDQRIAELEQARAFAHRRMNVIGAMCAVAPEGEIDACVQARLKALFRHVGWIDDSLDELDATEREVRDALLPVAQAIEAVVRPLAGPQSEPPPLTPLELFAVFEAWYLGRFACEFLDVFEQRAEFRPLVDF